MEKDAIGDDKALPTWVKFDTLIMPCWVLACKLASPTDDPFPRYKLRISTHSTLSMGVDIDANEEEDAIGDWGVVMEAQTNSPNGLEQSVSLL